MFPIVHQSDKHHVHENDDNITSGSFYLPPCLLVLKFIRSLPSSATSVPFCYRVWFSSQTWKVFCNAVETSVGKEALISGRRFLQIWRCLRIWGSWSLPMERCSHGKSRLIGDGRHRPQLTRYSFSASMGFCSRAPQETM